MPYIDPQVREDYDGLIHDINKQLPSSSGYLNYVISTIVGTWVAEDMCYDRINTAMGALECAKLELYRRIAAPYEDEKIAANGDIEPYRRLSS